MMTTAMALLAGPPLAHGLAVIPCTQTSGVGKLLLSLMALLTLFSYEK